MSEFNRKKKNNFWHSPLSLLVIFFVVVLFAYNIIGIIDKERETAKKKELILDQIETLRAREEYLKNDIEKLKTENGVEETIRDKYNVVKEGEKMVIIVDKSQPEQVEQVTEKKDHNFWSWIKKTFKL